VPVIIQNANSDVVASTLTDFDGVATASITGHGFVTVIEPREVSAPREILSTFAGVQGGDELHLDLAPLGPTEGAEFQLRVDLDTSPDALGGHRVLSACGPVEGFTFLADPEPPPITRLLGCGTTTDLLVVSLDELGEPLRSRFHPSVPLTGTQSLMGNFVAVSRRCSVSEHSRRGRVRRRVPRVRARFRHRVRRHHGCDGRCDERRDQGPRDEWLDHARGEQHVPDRGRARHAARARLG
jgi:hypothetical protein